MEIMRYKATELKRKRKLRQLSGLSSPEDLRGELAAARLLTQEALDGGNVGQTNLLLVTVGKLARDQTALKKANAEYVERAELRRLVERLCEIVADALANRGIPGWEDVVDDVADQLAVAVEPGETNE